MDICLVSKTYAQSLGDYLSHQQKGTQHRNHSRVKSEERGRERIELANTEHTAECLSVKETSHCPMSRVHLLPFNIFHKRQ